MSNLLALREMTLKVRILTIMQEVVFDMTNRENTITSKNVSQFCVL
jgi:hypothetical protein